MTRLSTLLYSAILVSGLAAPLRGQEVAPPQLGHVFDARSGRLLRLAGIPGAALATPAEPGGDFSDMAVSNDRGYALGVSASGEGVFLVDLSAMRPPRRMDVDPRPGRMALSPAGAAALLYYPGSVCVVQSLPAEPSASRCHPLQDGEPAALAVSDAGAILVASTAGVEIIDGQRRLALPLPAAVKAAAFRRGSSDAALAAAGEIWLAGEWNATPRLQALPLPVASPTAVSFSRDGARLYAAGEDGTVAEILLPASEVRTARCGCRPAALERLSGNGVFHLAGTDSPVLRLFDGDAPEPGTVFVPVPSGEAN